MSDRAVPTSERVDPPHYLATFRAKQRANESRGPSADTDELPAEDANANGEHTHANGSRDAAIAPSKDAEIPLYLRRFRQRPAAPQLDEDPTPASTDEADGTPLWQRAPLGVQQALTEDNRNKEISPPAAANRALANDVYLIRHGETQGYSTDSGLTPQGAWQAHTYGRTLAKRVKSGETVVFRHAETNRARETAEQIHRGFADGLVQYEKDVTIHEPAGMDEFRNFQFATPDGLKDVTAAFRQYLAELEGFKRSASGDRPLWLVEMDRFWRTQQGGADPIQHWLTIPMIHFEPPSMCVRRFWAGINRLSAEFPGARLAIATHSGPIRAFAVTTLGYDPGEPYNTEHVRVKILENREGDATDESSREMRARDAFVAYRNRVQETRVPNIEELPHWKVDEDWMGF